MISFLSVLFVRTLVNFYRLAVSCLIAEHILLNASLRVSLLQAKFNRTKLLLPKSAPGESPTPACSKNLNGLATGSAEASIQAR